VIEYHLIVASQISAELINADLPLKRKINSATFPVLGVTTVISDVGTISGMHVIDEVKVLKIAGGMWSNIIVISITNQGSSN